MGNCMGIAWKFGNCGKTIFWALTMAEGSDAGSIFAATTSADVSARIFGAGSGAATSMAQKRSQPSPLRRFSSSHCSPSSRMPSPHLLRLQSGRQAAFGDVEFIGPLSHSSPRSTVPSPQLRDARRHFLQS